MTERERLLSAVELMPDGSSVTLSCEKLIEALRGPEPIPPEPSPNGDCWLSAQEAAERLGFKRAWIYAHAEDLDFVKRVNGKLRCSDRGLHKYMATRR